MENKKLILIVFFIIGLIIVSSCQIKSLNNEKAKGSPIKTEKEAKLAFSNFTDSATLAVLDLEEVSRNLGR